MRKRREGTKENQREASRRQGAPGMGEEEKEKEEDDAGVRQLDQRRGQ